MSAGQSLGQLAALIYPDDPAMQRRFIAEAVRETPATFSQTSPSHRFKRATLIWMPDLKALSRYGDHVKPPHRDLQPALPNAEHRASDAKLLPLQASAAVEGKPTSTVGGIGAMAAIDALIARNEHLKQVQHVLDIRIAELELAIGQVKKVLMGESPRQTVQHIRRVEPVARPTPPVQPHEDTLLAPSPFHLATAAGVLLSGVALLLLRRRIGWNRGGTDVVAVTVASKKPISDFGEPTGPAIHVEENFVSDGLISVDEIESIVEEAKVFVALGRTEYAIEVLENYVITHPRSSAHPWLYLMDIHRSMQNRAAFEAVAKRFHQAMNVVIPQWESVGQVAMVVAHSLEEFPHITARLIEGWAKRDAQDFLNHLLQDNRGGERQGFSMEVLQEILLLLAVIELRDHLPPLEPF